VGRRLSPARYMGPMVNGGPLGPAFSGVEEGEAGIPLRLHPPHLKGEEVGIPFHPRPRTFGEERQEYPSVYTPRSLEGVETGIPFRLCPPYHGGE